MNRYLKSVISKLDTQARTALDSAVHQATSNKHIHVRPEHLFLSIIDLNNSLVLRFQDEIGFSFFDLITIAKRNIDTIQCDSKAEPVLAPDLVDWLFSGWLLASSQWGIAQLSPEALIATLLDGMDKWTYSFIKLIPFGERENVKNILRDIATKHSLSSEIKEESTTLGMYTRNLSEQARRGILDPITGRDVEIRQMVDILLRRRQNNPILVGEPGVGKTALAEGLAMRIANGDIPNSLKSMEVLTLDMGLLQAGASVKGEFENRLKLLLKEISCAPNPIILFIDEAHSLIGAGGQVGQNDAANLLKPALARGELRVVAATTWAEYKRYFEKDAALARRFHLVKVGEPNFETAVAMLRSIAPLLSNHHGVPIQESAIIAAVKLSSRYLTDRQLPDKSVSLLDTACARVAVSQIHEPKEITAIRAQLKSINSEYEALRLEFGCSERISFLTQDAAKQQSMLDTLLHEWKFQIQLVQKLQKCDDRDEVLLYRDELNECHRRHAMVFESVDTAAVADVVADWTGIPLGRMLDKDDFSVKTFVQSLAGYVIGQQHALEEIVQTISISRAGLGDPLKPIGVFLLAGPSGTGKTETSIALSDLLFGGEQSLITINMSEYQEAHSVAGLKGSPPGYVGFGQGGRLTEAVRRNPYSVVLLDEVEKAHPDVIELFYQIFDKGLIEDAEGQVVNFRNTLILMTSNIGGSTISSIRNCEHKKIDELRELIRPEFEKVLGSALMGRITLIPYQSLNSKSLVEIIEIKIQKICQRYYIATGNETKLHWDANVVRWILKKCNVHQSGARNIDYVISYYLLPLLSNYILSKRNVENLKVIVTKGELALCKDNE